MSREVSISEHVRPILAAIRTVPIPAKFGQETQRPLVPFVTISREVGAGGWTLAQALADSLNRSEASGHPWSAWDRELVEKVSADQRISARLVESLENRDRSWIDDFFASLSFSDSPGHADELAVFHGVARSIRALAQTGRVIIVGRGGVFLTRQMPGGVHIRLVAPLNRRIEHMRQRLNLTRDQAARHVQEMSRRRDAFYRAYWPSETIRADLFTAVLNTERVSQEGMIAAIQALVRDAGKNAAQDAPAPPPGE